MVSLLHCAALGFCIIGCCFMVRHSNWAWRVSAAVMIASMVDVIVGPYVLPPIGWSALLVNAAVMVLIKHLNHMAHVATTDDKIPHSSPVAESLQMSFGLIAMAATMPFMHVEPVVLCIGGNAGQASFSAFPMLAIAPVLYAGLGYYVISCTIRSIARIMEATAMTLSLALMTSTSLFHLS